jgi:hypothetical protein
VDDPDRGPHVTFRLAKREDLETIVRMLADDPLGAKGETSSLPLLGSHSSAFEAIVAFDA